MTRFNTARDVLLEPEMEMLAAWELEGVQLPLLRPSTTQVISSRPLRLTTV